VSYAGNYMKKKRSSASLGLFSRCPKASIGCAIDHNYVAEEGKSYLSGAKLQGVLKQFRQTRGRNTASRKTNVMQGVDQRLLVHSICCEIPKPLLL
jgi:hypothetical protein